MDLELLEHDPRRRRRAALPRPAGVGVGRARRDAATTEMTDLPAALRERAGARAAVLDRSTLRTRHASRDGTVKALFATADGRPVEAVLMRYRDGRRSICVSLAVGLPADLHLLRDRAR